MSVDEEEEIQEKEEKPLPFNQLLKNSGLDLEDQGVLTSEETLLPEEEKLFLVCEKQTTKLLSLDSDFFTSLG